jgi:hypothetical protein
VADGPAVRQRVVVAIACTAAIAVLLGYWPVQLIGTGWLPMTGDDSFYYLEVARRLAETGRSSFDGQTLTNGYHPLWQLILTLQYLLVGDSGLATLLLQLVAFSLAVWVVLTVSELESWALPLFALVLFIVFRGDALTGMELALLLFCFALFMAALRHGSWIWVGVAGGLTIGARLDAAFFVVPALLLVPPLAARLQSLALIGGCGAVYAVANQLMFGAWLPVSASIKSLGGFGFNRPLLAQLHLHWDIAGSFLGGLLHFALSLDGWTLFAAVGSVLLLAVSVGHRRRAEWRFAAAMVLGFVAFLVKLLLFSSWAIWPWYFFPAFFLLAADFRLMALLLAERPASSSRLVERTTLAVGVGLIAFELFWAVRAPPLADPYLVGTRTIARDARALIGDAYIGMGDRAGAFAYFYGGAVSQLEGLANDVEFFRAIAEKQPIKPILCRRGVRYLVHYDSDLGDYRTHVARLFNPVTASFPGPTLEVAREDEVGKLSTPSVIRLFPANPYVYIWRITGC